VCDSHFKCINLAISFSVTMSVAFSRLMLCHPQFLFAAHSTETHADDSGDEPCIASVLFCCCSLRHHHRRCDHCCFKFALLTPVQMKAGPGFVELNYAMFNEGIKSVSKSMTVYHFFTHNKHTFAHLCTPLHTFAHLCTPFTPPY
jgi:hypothetical protein